jgi:hypothetical protein
MNYNETILSVREVERQYAALLRDVETKDFYKINLSNRVNCYRCQHCGVITKTIDIHAGVTPFIFECMCCGKDAYSTFYTDIAIKIKPSFEWYRPTLEECLKLRKKPYTLDHVLKGGLLSRKINTI